MLLGITLFIFKMFISNYKEEQFCVLILDF